MSAGHGGGGAGDDGMADHAGEFVLGTLAPQAADALAERIPRDRDLARQVYAWQDRLLPLTRRAEALAPAPGLWRRIEQALDAGAAAQSARRSAPRPAAQAPSWWQRLGLWQGLSAAAVAASLLMGSLLLMRANVPEPARYLTLLQSPDEGRTAWVVEMRAGGQVRLVPVADTAAVPPDRVLQFWTKPKGAAGPTSLGLVQVGQTVELPVSRLPAVEAEQLFELTLEPAGGSPIGRPTGPILFVGRSVRL